MRLKDVKYYVYTLSKLVLVVEHLFNFLVIVELMTSGRTAIDYYLKY